MGSEPEHLNALEEALVELDDAERALVFQRTQLDARELVTRAAPSVSGTSRRWVVQLVGMAAAMGAVIGLWAWFSGGQPRGAHQRLAQPMGVNGYTQVATYTTFRECFGGPTTAEEIRVCRQHDFDADGDVDLADFGAYQVAYAHVTH